ncbi:hypothetical protein [Erythrobacter sp. SD-21]|uniref:hypothetical protein n=1 Tax=Erythrobacter sp. SD-21 TaxID=161528 RepID=UPI000153F9A9|nr:hypothetical protein [Erythrobacter sp. SD-21]EDL48472.1 hypothetical protein ED21_23188 [Erythrobacter sp. SD-21]
MTRHPDSDKFARDGDDAAAPGRATHDAAHGHTAPTSSPAQGDPWRHDGWTRARQAAFLRELAATHNVSAAARAVGMSRQSAYKLRARLRGTPFDKGWEAAFVSRFDALADAALDRALNGVEVPHYYNGELVGTSRRYDERLTLALLAMRATFNRQPRGHYDPADAFGIDELAALADRVEHGPEQWHKDCNSELDARDDLDREAESVEKPASDR